MARINPVVKRDLTFLSRSFRSSFYIAAFTAVLFVAAYTGMNDALFRLESSLELNYESFLSVYLMLSVLQMLLLSFMSAAFTAGGIAAERSTKTLDLVMTTRFPVFRFVHGKLLVAMIRMLLLIAASAPVLAIPLAYGGIGVQCIAGIGLLSAFETLYLILICLFSGSFGESAARSAVRSFCIVLLLVLGLPLIVAAADLVSPEGRNISAYLLVFDPLLPVFSLAAGQIGKEAMVGGLFRIFGLTADTGFIRYLPALCVILHAAASVLCLLLTVVNVSPKPGRKPLPKKESVL